AHAGPHLRVATVPAAMTGTGPGGPEPPGTRWDLGSGPRMPDPRMIPRPDHRPTAGGAAGRPDEEEPAEEETDSDPFVRPFYVTGGRTQPLHDGLRLHTLVTAPPSALHSPLRFELRRIVELCQSPHSLAEIASHLGVPVGVTRVLIADLLSGGYVT